MKSLLQEVIEFRDECKVASEQLMPWADPGGAARTAYKVAADMLSEIIKRHNNAEASGRAAQGPFAEPDCYDKSATKTGK